MLRALFTAVTGVRAHQTMLDVTGNNISNVNTTGFKKDNTIFADLMYQANKYASGAGDSRGGINPAQVGLGVSVSAIETIHTQGSSQYTGNAADMMIQDKGFFVYQNGNSQLYSRSGALTLDNNGDMVMSGSGYKLQGYEFEETALEGYKQASELSTVNIPLGQKIDAHATSRVDYQCNLNSESKAYLPYGFADIPYNAVAGWKGNSNGTARVTMGGTEYDMSFNTHGLDVNASSLSSAAITANTSSYNASGTGVQQYLNIDLSNGGTTTRLGFDMIGVDKDSGLPNLSLPGITATPATYNANGTVATYTYTYPTRPTGLATDTDTPLTFVGLLTESNILLTGDSGGTTFTAYGGGSTTGTAYTIPAGTDQKALNSYMPVYQFPGSTPPQYFAAQYDDSTGALQLRELKFYNAAGTDITSQATTAGLTTDLTTATALAGATIRASASVFSYNMHDNMNYTSFTLKGAPTLPAGIGGNTSNEAAATNVEYNFVAEFDERAEDTGSDLSKRASTVTLWYYGISNADAGAAATAVARMHKLEATVYFNADGTFDSVEWADVDNSNAPLGYRIVDGGVPSTTAGAVGPNFQIAVGSATSTSSAKDTLNFKQAQNLDTPGALTNDGVWTTQGTTFQGGYHATKMTIYDDNGKTHTLEVSFKKITENRWRWEAFLVEQDEDTGEDEIVNIIPDPRTGEIEFDGSGRISNVIADSTDGQRRGDGNDRFPNAEVEITLPFSLNGQPNSTITLNFGGGVGSGGSALEGVTQFASETTTKPVYQDGYTMGVLKNYSVAVDGTITGSYDNGVNIPLYRVALATFANEQGLEKVGDSMFQATVNSGNANIDGATTNGKGKIMSQYLEMSNVDLTEEFTHLIIAQRGFQANTRVITTSDQILEEVVNLKR